MIDPNLLSVIVPVRNGGAAFRRCLAALHEANTAGHELLVVDDGSSDGSAELAAAFGARVIKTQDTRLKTQEEEERAPSPAAQPVLSAGPAAARNLGARAARGEVLLFVDADIAAHPDTLARAARAFLDDPDLAAAFGSYDEQPADRGFLSQFKNLFHHYVHQHARAEASTFWAGCGAIRRSVFLALAGFDEVTYPRPSIEDIELGYRLARAGAKVRLLKDWQVTHLKRWTFGGLLRTDLFDRGVPWTRLLWRESLHASAAGAPRPFLMDLNLQTANRVSVVCVYLLGLALAGAALHLASLGAALAPLVALLWLNRDLYAFFAARRGWSFTARAVAFHWFYYLYNGVSFALGTLAYLRDGAPKVAPDGRWVSESRDLR
jgi:glycosyltransferase involved in cell wall biosynthesis